MDTARFKLRKALTRDQAVSFLAELSEGLSGRALSSELAREMNTDLAHGLTIPPDIGAIKLHLWSQSGGYLLKMEISEPEAPEAATPVPETTPDRNPPGLRKLVRLDMAILSWFVSESRLPATHDLDRIYARMDEFVASVDQESERLKSLKAAAQDLKDSASAWNLDGLKSAIQRINQLRADLQ